MVYAFLTPKIKNLKCPFEVPHKDATEVCLKRRLVDYERLKGKLPEEVIYLSKFDENSSSFYFTLIGKENSVYKGGFYHFYVRLPHNYPVAPPMVCCITSSRLGSPSRFSPYFLADGTVQIPILSRDLKVGWSPVKTLVNFMEELVKLFLRDEVPSEFMRNVAESSVFMCHEVIRVAVLKFLTVTKDHDFHKETNYVMFKEFYKNFDYFCSTCEIHQVGDDKDILMDEDLCPFIPFFGKMFEQLLNLKVQLESAAPESVSEQNPPVE